MYQFVHGNPVTLRDPGGLGPWEGDEGLFKTYPGYDRLTGMAYVPIGPWEDPGYDPGHVSTPKWIGRIQGIVKTVGGVAETIIGIGAASTGVGVVVAVHGADVAIAGVGQIISGEDQETITKQAVREAAISAGMPPDAANTAANIVDNGISIGAAGLRPDRIVGAAEGAVSAARTESAVSEAANSTRGGSATITQGANQASSPQSTAASVSSNPSNRLVETGIPLKDGSGWVRRWTRMTEQDEIRMASERASRYDELLREAQGLHPDSRQAYIFDQMRAFRVRQRQQFLEEREY